VAVRWIPHFVIVALALAMALAFFQSRWAKGQGGQTRSVRRAETIAKTPMLQDMAQPKGGPLDALNYRDAHLIADVAAGAMDHPDGAYEPLDMLDPNYKKNHP